MHIIAQISDLHFGRHDPVICTALLASLNDLSPNLVAISGDLTQRARTREFIAARRFLDHIAAPKLIVPGNHDIPLYNVAGRMLAPLAKYRRFIAPAGLISSLVADDDTAVLGLSTVRRLTGKHGRISPAQIARIRHVFEAVPPRAFKVLVTHHPLGITSGGASLTLAGRSALALEAISAVGVHLLLSGHHHRTSHGVIDAEMAADSSILIVHAGTAMSTRIRQEPNSYNLIRIYGSRISVTVMEWLPPAFRASATASYALIDGHWQTAQPVC
jgi:3',5'-cyclic AMP phosphodiesterase CpdA